MSLKYSLAVAAYRGMYRRHARAPLAERIVFLSRQGDEMSVEFRLLAAELGRLLPGWEIASDCYRDAGSPVQRLRRSASQARAAATARLVVVDGWNPAVCIPELREGTHVVQLWHAFGAVKQFGWQAVGCAYGRSAEQARQLCMHRNYDVVVAGGPGAVPAFSQAFDMPAERIVPWGTPLMDVFDGRLLAAESEKRARELARRYPVLEGPAPRVLYAPTFRKGADADAVVGQAVDDLAAALAGSGYELVMCPHPVFAATDAPQAATVVEGARSSELYRFADYVVTDYSSVAFEAAYAGCKVLFYCPDIARFRDACGLNVDPFERFAGIAFANAAELAAWLARGDADAAYEASGYAEFVHGYLGMPREDVTARIAGGIVELLEA